MKIKSIIVIVLGILIATSCSKDDETPAPSSAKEITSFKIDNIVSTISGDKIILNVDTNEDDFYFLPQITVSDKAKISPTITSAIDFAQPVTFTVTAEDNSTKTYTTQIVRKDGIIQVNFVFSATVGARQYTYPGHINNTNRTITVELPKSKVWTADYTAKINLITLGAVTTLPNSGSVITKDLSELTLTTKNGSEKYSIVTRNTENELINIELPIVSSNPKSFPYGKVYPKYAAGLQDGDRILFTLETTDITNLTPSKLELSEGATSSPTATSAINFTNDVRYQVTSQSKITKDYTVRVIKKKIIMDKDEMMFYTPLTSTSFATRYNAISKITKASLINVVSKEETPCTITQNTYSEQEKAYILKMTMTKTAKFNDDFYLRVTLENGDVIDTDAFFESRIQ